MKNLLLSIFVFISSFVISQSCTHTKNSRGYFSIFPNTSSGEFQVVLNNKQLIGDGNLIIEDSKGREAHNRIIKISQGINIFSVSNINLETGVYYIKIVTGNSSTIALKHMIN